LTGVGAAHQADGSDGELRSSSTNFGKLRTINPSALDRLPPYQQHIGEDDGVPLLARNTVVNGGIAVREDENDEAIDMGDGINYNNLGNPLNQNWTWDNIGNIGMGPSKIAAPSGADSEATYNESLNVDGRSDIVQNNSSASETSLSRRRIDFDTAEVEADWEEPEPIPDLAEDDRVPLDQLHDELRAGILARGFNRDDMVGEFNIPPDMDEDEIEEPATEIILEDNEGLKTD
jgi:ubiquitin carboxyl-terminal hydrolase 4/11/15